MCNCNYNVKAGALSNMSSSIDPCSSEYGCPVTNDGHSLANYTNNIAT